MIYDRPPPSISRYIQGTSSIDAVDTLLVDRTELHAALLRRLGKAQEAMKASADTHRRDVQFSVGD